ncbi:MAG: tubulin-like doman-containing protein [Muribaculaceae bacterium]|nr:tubulin-like doman-containing protein [Muribaculaceae bacterium]
MATKLRRTLFVGLGGTGMKALLYTKKMFYDTYGEIPPMIGFLGIDTDGDVYNNTLHAIDGSVISLSQAEQLPICVEHPNKIYSVNPKNYDWLPKANAGSLTTLTIGAGAVRSNGRFAVTIHEEDIANRINIKRQQIAAAENINNEKYSLLGSGELEVHLVFSLGGGTGCGTFINMAYLLQRLLPGAKLSGYAVMADVFRAMMTGASMVRVRPNAMGAITDLDYLMELNVASAPVEIKWLKEVEKVNTPPFTALYLIDNKNQEGTMFNNVDQLCEMISLALVTTTGELSIAAASVSDNVAKVIGDGSMDILNKKAWIAGFGVSEICFNSDALARIYANKARIQLASMMLNGGCDDPSKIANEWFDVNKIRENLGKDDVIDYFMTPTPKFVFSDISNKANPRPECEQYLNSRAIDPQKELDEKLETLKSRISESFNVLVNENLNRECGLFLAENILNVINTQIELCDQEMDQEIKELEDRLVQVTAAGDSLLSELESASGIFNGKKRNQLANDVCDNVMNKVRLMREIKRRRMARLFYSWLSSILRPKYKMVDDIIINVKQMMTSSSEAIESIRQSMGNVSFFQEDLAINAVDKVTCHTGDIVFNDFIKYILPLGGIPSLATSTSQDVNLLFWNYVNNLERTKSYRKVTIERVLNDLDPDTLRRVCERAIRKSLPLLPYNYQGYDAEVKSAPVDNYYIGVADKDKTILAKHNYFKNLVPSNSNTQFASTGVADKIIIYRQFGVIPAFCISSLEGYRDEYKRFESEKEFTSHWDANLTRRMRKERHDLNPKTTSNPGEHMETWLQALLFGLISYDAAKGMYFIKSKGLGGKPTRGFKVEMAASRAKAYDFLVDNLDILGDEVKAYVKSISKPGPDNPVATVPVEAHKAAEDGTYIEKFAICNIPLESLESYPEEEELLNNEIMYILENL